MDKTIKFNHNCMILVGKNEAGKSNSLKAVAAVFGKFKVKNRDRRKKIEDEKIDSNFIRAIFTLTDEDFNNIEEIFLSRYTGTDNIIFKNGDTLKKFIRRVFREFLIQIDIEDDSTPHFSYWDYPEDEFELETPIQIIENTIILGEGETLILESNLFTIVKEIYNLYPINCHYWQYSDDYLLPNSLNLNAFIGDPSICKSLEYIFYLCNKNDIKKEFEDALHEDGDYAIFLEQLSKNVTKIFQKIWYDFKDTSIQILPNGDELIFKVVNKTKYSFEDRSDGFKKFISILLMLSTQARAKKIRENDIILLDEPDQSLYPTSAQYLKDELIEISKKSKIIYSTHSQYMIDSNQIDRHIVVEKKDDITTLKIENANAPFSTDELLRRAIGSGIFECLNSKNIIFEGYLDKEIFNKYCTFHNRNNEFKSFGMVFLSGISGVETLVQLLILANKKFVIVADSDEASVKRRIEFVKNYPEYKSSWLAYADICESVSTMEDFISDSYISNFLVKEVDINYVYNGDKTAIYNIEKAVNNDKVKKQDVKNNLIKGILKSKIKNDYKVFVDGLKQKLEDI